MTSSERIHALVTAIEYLVSNDIEGDIVECGVWRGGSMMAAALALRRLEVGGPRPAALRHLRGHVPAREVDADLAGRKASRLMKEADPETSHVWAVANMDLVKKNMASTGYPDRAHLLRAGQGRGYPAGQGAGTHRPPSA
ncbi:MAG: TylF/MycF/NovP-related O-methyltransferase [Balneolaceae bacterium]|nr:TylF/MycF/NovP-related O-methyltransferase [Balneolaceae bacterium]